MCKGLVSLAGLCSVLISTACLAAKSSYLYFPDDNFCAVYQGSIEDREVFPMWVEKNRQLVIKTDKDLRVAVVFNNRIVPAYQIDVVSDAITSQYFYKTSQTGNYLITINGGEEDVNLSFCLK